MLGVFLKYSHTKVATICWSQLFTKQVSQISEGVERAHAVLTVVCTEYGHRLQKNVSLEYYSGFKIQI